MIHTPWTITNYCPTNWGLLALCDHVLVVASASSGIASYNFRPHFIAWLNNDPCCVLLSTVISKDVFEFKQIGIPYMTGRIDEIWKKFVCRNGINQNKLISEHNYLGELRPDFHCHMFYLHCLVLCLFTPWKWQMHYTLGPVENYLFQDKKNFEIITGSRALGLYYC